MINKPIGPKILSSQQKKVIRKALSTPFIELS